MTLGCSGELFSPQTEQLGPSLLRNARRSLRPRNNSRMRRRPTLCRTHRVEPSVMVAMVRTARGSGRRPAPPSQAVRSSSWRNSSRWRSTCPRRNARKWRSCSTSQRRRWGRRFIWYLEQTATDLQNVTSWIDFIIDMLESEPNCYTLFGLALLCKWVNYLINILHELLLEPSNNEYKVGGAFSLYEVRYEYIMIRKPENILSMGKLRWG